MPTSFIPKKPLVGESRGGGALSGILVLVAILLFGGSIAAAVGAFTYSKVLEKSIENKAASLEKDEDAFNIKSIQELARLDMRLTEAQALLDNHIAPSAIFTFLSAATLERVQFTGFTAEIGKDGSAHLEMGGIADSFSTLALQSDEFSAAKVLRDVIFSGITTDASGRVVFSVTASMDPSLVSYAKNNAAANAPADAPSN